MQKYSAYEKIQKWIYSIYVLFQIMCVIDIFSHDIKI